MVRRGVFGLLLLCIPPILGGGDAKVEAQRRGGESARIKRGEKPGTNLWGVELRTRIATPDGAFVLYDAPRAEDAPRLQVGYLAYWNDFAADEVYVFGQLIRARSDVLDALRSLRHDFGIDPHDLAPDVFAEERADSTDAEPVNPADAPVQGNWSPATRRRVMEIAGLWLPEDVDPSVPPVVVAAPIPRCDPCYMATAGGDVAPLNIGDPYNAAVAAACNCCNPVVCPNCDDRNACTRDYCNIVSAHQNHY